MKTATAKTAAIKRTTTGATTATTTSNVAQSYARV